MVEKFIGCNFSVKKNIALKLGGFAENFVHVAYRFESEFAERALEAGEKILFVPDASIRHLKETNGGTRSYGEHLRTATPSHSVGAYYYFLRSRRRKQFILNILRRLMLSVKTKHHLRNPFWIPITLVSEFLGIAWAIMLFMRGQRLIGWDKKSKNR